MHTFLLVITLTPAAALIDYVWLGVIAKSFYTNQLGDLMRPSGIQLDPRLLAAILIYIFITIGVILFILPKAQTIYSVILWGALLGFILYTIYNLTNLAVLTSWPLALSVVDIIWGTVFVAFLSLIGFYLNLILP